MNAPALWTQSAHAGDYGCCERRHEEHIPVLGTSTAYMTGMRDPSTVTTVTVIDRVRVEGSGKERYMNASNLTEELLH
jgi:hypothetical protein